MTADTSDRVIEQTELLDILEAVKQEQPELSNILEQFQMDYAEYDRALLSILSPQLMVHDTYGIAGDG